MLGRRACRRRLCSNTFTGTSMCTGTRTSWTTNRCSLRPSAQRGFAFPLAVAICSARLAAELEHFVLGKFCNSVERSFDWFADDNWLCIVCTAVAQVCSAPPRMRPFCHRRRSMTERACRSMHARPVSADRRIECSCAARTIHCCALQPMETMCRAHRIPSGRMSAPRQWRLCLAHSVLSMM